MVSNQERLNSLKELQRQKVEQLNRLEQAKTMLTNEIIEISGKIKLLNEMISEEKSQKSDKNENEQQSPNGKEVNKTGDDSGGNPQRHRGNQG